MFAPSPEISLRFQRLLFLVSFAAVKCEASSNVDFELNLQKIPLALRAPKNAYLCKPKNKRAGHKMNIVFPCCANWETLIKDTKCFWTKSDTFFVSATNVARAGKRGNICVGNNVSATMCPLLPGPSLLSSLSSCDRNQPWVTCLKLRDNWEHFEKFHIKNKLTKLSWNFIAVRRSDCRHFPGRGRMQVANLVYKYIISTVTN